MIIRTTKITLFDYCWRNRKLERNFENRRPKNCRRRDIAEKGMKSRQAKVEDKNVKSRMLQIGLSRFLSPARSSRQVTE